MPRSLSGNLHQIGGKEIGEKLQALGPILNKLQKYTTKRAPISLGSQVHSLQTGDSDWVKDWTKDTLKPQWTRPHTVVLITPNVLKVSDVTPLVHQSRVKKSPQSEEESHQQKTQPDPMDPLQLHLQQDLTD